MKVGVLTGGGDCPGLNQAIRGIILRSLDYGIEVIGLRDGWAGLVKGLTMPLDLKTADEIIAIGGTILGSSRTNPFKKEAEDVPKCMETFKKLGLDALIAIGGEDTLGAANNFHKKGLNVVGVPKTMDNDLSATDYTFGFDTATTLAMDAVERLRDTGKSHHRIMVLEVMGRHAGWVALFTGIASGADWTLIPEKKVNFDEMCKHLKKAWDRKGYGIVVASEGIEFAQEGAEQEKDAFGHIILKKRGVASNLEKEIEKRTGIETRSAVIGHMQRGGPPTLFDRILSLRVGVKAMDLVKDGKFGMIACLKGNKVEAVLLEEAVSKLKTVDDEWWSFAKVFFK